MSTELALSLMLLTGAGLMLRSLGKMSNVEPGFEHTHLLTLSINLPAVSIRQIELQIKL